MMELNGFEIDVYNIHKIKEGQKTSTCPVCSHNRKKKEDKCAMVDWGRGLLTCQHCGEVVQLHTYKKKATSKTYTIPLPRAQKQAFSEVLLKWFSEVRGISESTLKRLKIGESKRWMPKANKEIQVIEFPYYVFGQLINIKYRGKDKDFMFEKGAELVMYNLDSIAHEKECYYVEGELDCLAFVESGIENVVSVPNGFTLPKKDGTSSINLSFIDDYYSFFENKEKIYLATDNDEAGRHGRDELIRRFGSEKCWIIDFKDCKDANEYLLKYGKEALATIAQTSTQIPLEHVETITDFEQELDDFYLNGCPKGYITGMHNLDYNYSIEFGQYCVILGVPQCFYSDQLIHTSQGVKKISDITIGEHVLSYNHEKRINEYRKVTNTIINEGYPDELYEITLKDGTVIKVTENHEFFIDTRYMKIKDILLSLPHGKNLDENT